MNQIFLTRLDFREDGRGNLRDKIASLNPEKELEKEKSIWTRTSPGDLYYERDQSYVSECFIPISHLIEIDFA